MSGVNGGANAAPAAPAPPATIEPQAITKYLSRVLESTLGATDEELRAVGSLLNEANLDDTFARCLRFAQEQQMALYVLRQAPVAPLENGHVNGDAPTQHDEYVLSSEVSYSSRTLGCVAFLKRPASIQPDIPISKQVSVVNLPLPGSAGSVDSGSAVSPYESLHSFVRGALTPFFEAAARGSESRGDKLRSDGESRTGIAGARRKARLPCCTDMEACFSCRMVGQHGNLACGNMRSAAYLGLSWELKSRYCK